MTNISDMSQEELDARSDAAVLGQLQMMRTAIEALIASAPQPDFIAFCLTQKLAALANETQEDPALAWVPEAVCIGATPVAEQFLAACRANRNFKA